jgi:D-3-phosphoglycerate dehydrogenase
MINNPSEASLILVRSFNMHEFTPGENLIAVGRAGAGVNNIPLDTLADKGVVVFNTPGANANGVKELVVAGMLLASRDIIGGVNWVNENKADENLIKSIEKAKKAFAGNELMGKTISVIGLGAIGGKVANIAYDLGMKVYGYDPYISEAMFKQLNKKVEISNDLDFLYQNSDFISLHLPLLDSTKQMINQSVFNKVKNGAVLLNFSRDALVHDEDLKVALEKGIIRKYVTDFPSHFVANLNNVIAIPHLGASTDESEENCAIMAVQQLMGFVELGDIVNSVNYPNVVLGNINGEQRLIILAKSNDDLTYKIDQALKPVEKLIETSVSKSKKGYSVYAYDFKVKLSDEILENINKIDGVTRIRTI